jgi:hypothetical protein
MLVAAVVHIQEAALPQEQVAMEVAAQEGV